MHIQHQTDVSQFLKAVDHNIDNIKNNKSSDNESINSIIQDFQNFADNNQTFISTDSTAYNKFKELAKVVAGLDSNDNQYERIKEISLEALSIKPAIPKRKKNVGGGSTVSPGNIQRAEKNMITEKQPDEKTFLNAVNENLTKVKELKQPLNHEAYNALIENFQNFAENNQNFISTNATTYEKFETLGNALLGIKGGNNDQFEKLETIFLEALEKKPEKTKVALKQGQLEGIYKKIDEEGTIFSISSKDNNGKENTYNAKSMIASAGEASIFIAEGTNGDLVAIRVVKLMPSKKDIRNGAPEKPGRDVKRDAEFEKKMKETGDERLKHLNLKTEVIISRDIEQKPKFAFQVMPLAEMSVNKIAFADKYTKLPEQQQLQVASYVGKQLITGLAFLHEQTTVHHDVKLDNLLLMKDGTIKLTDYGFTKTFDEETKMPVDTINPKFMSPELARNGKVEGGADIWSAGLALAELCGVESPDITLQDLKDGDKMKTIVDNLLEKVGEKSPIMKDLIAKMLVVDPERRASAAELLNHAAFQEQISPEDFMNIVGSLKS